MKGRKPCQKLDAGQWDTIIDKHTGELIRELTLDTTRRCQPQTTKPPEP